MKTLLLSKAYIRMEKFPVKEFSLARDGCGRL